MNDGRNAVNFKLKPLCVSILWKMFAFCFYLFNKIYSSFPCWNKKKNNKNLLFFPHHFIGFRQQVLQHLAFSCLNGRDTFLGTSKQTSLVWYATRVTIWMADTRDSEISLREIPQSQLRYVQEIGLLGVLASNRGIFCRNCKEECEKENCGK